jgi:beta-galactosidase
VESSEPSGPHLSLSLNGTWEIAPGDAESPGLFGSTVPVPGLVDLGAPGYAWQDVNYHWYRRTFPIRGRDKFAHSRIVLEQSMFGTTAWLNGSLIGGDIACYTSQEYDVTGFLEEGENRLVVRVGNRSTLPPESAVGHDQERKVFIPGIWGDVRLERSGVPRVAFIQVVPHIREAKAEIRVRFHNPTPGGIDARSEIRIVEAPGGRIAGEASIGMKRIPGRAEHMVVIQVAIEQLRCWEPDDPFLYHCVVDVLQGAAVVDRRGVRFGMREFTIEGGDFLLNGRKILLRGGNIAFHRFLSDDERGALPWELAWIKKVLIDLPKSHHFNFFRAHIGQMYNRWYDIADEHGMLLQNEWQFWTASGSKDQITQEFTRWIEDNAHHPSIVIWDPLNESTDRIVQDDIVPLMKQIDPSRPWESVDFVEEHPYIYSLGPVLNDRKFGFTRALQDIAADRRPTMINEFLWWWLDRDGNPTTLMEGVVERWLGPGWTREALVERQGFLATELIELFRRMGVDAIQPFVYLSNNGGPTAHWFQRDIRDLVPKPLLAGMKNAFAPEGVSLELWDRHFFESEERWAQVFVFNDRLASFSGMLEWGVTDLHGGWLARSSKEITVPGVSTNVLPVQFSLPGNTGQVLLTARVRSMNDTLLSYSNKPGFVYGRPVIKRAGDVALYPGSNDGEHADFLSRRGYSVIDAEAVSSACHAVLVGEGRVQEFASSRERMPVQQYVAAGGTLLVVEPEYGVRDHLVVEVLDNLMLTIHYRPDEDRGGYDSAVFPTDNSHPVWKGIDPEHLQMFNGGWGGEMVSQHDVASSLPATVLARCGLYLKTPALLEIPYGEGRVVVSRIQVRGRLGVQGGDGLYDRRPDPVAMTLLGNLIDAFSSRA